jgi:nucleoside-diphosphate-sugar epimerase
MKKERILITGGGGYIGTSLIPLLLEKGYEVTVYDSLMFNNGDNLLPYIPNPNFKFIKGDIRDQNKIKGHINNNDIIIHLAAYVGYGICRERGEVESHEVNTLATKSIVNMLSNEQYILFGSTGSNYGEVSGICTEETPLNPLSIYGRTKTEAELIVMSRPNSIAYRFATAFGVSARLRLDLLINDLTYKALTQKYAVIYESHFLRTFIHVRDIANSFLFAIENKEKMRNNVYNVGSNSMNYSKKEICELIKSCIPDVLFHYADIGEDADKRNYKVSYEKINKLGFETSITIQQGIEELIKANSLVNIKSPYHNS